MSWLMVSNAFEQSNDTPNTNFLSLNADVSLSISIFSAMNVQIDIDTVFSTYFWMTPIGYT